MNTRNIQTFLMVSAAFFAMNAPVRSGSAETLANAVAHTVQIAPVRLASDRIASEGEAADEEEGPQRPA
jgi:hypothetical protein